MTLKGLYSIFLILFLVSCKNYSFTGTNLSPDLKSFTISNFIMATAGGPTNMAFSFNEKLKEYYRANTNLKLKSEDGDLQLAGSIITYELQAISATAGDKAAVNRLNITVEVRFINKLSEKENFEKEFTFYQDFPQEQSLTTVEPKLVPKILDQLVLNIFNATAATW